MTDMDNILNGSTGDTETVIDETVDTAVNSAEETTTETTATDTTPADQTAVSAAAGPTEAEKQAAALLKEVERLRAKNRELEVQVRPPEKVDFWEEPEKIIEQRVNAVEERLTMRFLDMSEAAAKARHPDFNQKYDVFAELIRDRPDLYGAMLNSPDPGEFVYKTAAQAIAVKEMGDPDAYRAKLESEIRAKLEAEFETKRKAEAEALIDAKLKGGFSEVRAVGDREKKLAGHRPMSEILGGKK